MTIKSDGGSKELKFTGATGQNVVPFQTRDPEFITDATSGFKAKVVTYSHTKGPTEVNQIMVHDPDSSSGSLKFTFQGVDTSQIKKLEAVKVSEVDGKVHYSIRATAAGKKASKTMTVRMTATDQNGGTAQQDFGMTVRCGVLAAPLPLGPGTRVLRSLPCPPARALSLILSAMRTRNQTPKCSRGRPRHTPSPVPCRCCSSITPAWAGRRTC